MLESMLENGKYTGMKVREPGTSYNILPNVSLHPLNWVSKDIIFFAEHGLFPACLKRFKLAHNDFCTCGGIGTAFLSATECILTISWYLRKSEPNLVQRVVYDNGGQDQRSGGSWQWTKNFD
ncbi:hypothetical protein AVEN_173787-1 [Araneus ventricosus]|uniref:Uncharacterized protein n=1 Tax=Araneus ventricosus TaxID=182803 RepID=A0A4Y2EVK8_ARAVE|nr:hypothetical protein AVEN_173787-1 [Araneus ventricosus]